MDKVTDTGHRTQDTGVRGHSQGLYLLVSCVLPAKPMAWRGLAKTIFLGGCLVFLSGCATAPKRPVTPVAPAETINEQIDAAQKVVGAMANREVSRNDLKALATDIRKEEETRSAVQAILGGSDKRPVIKYSPVTGKHYSGDLEYDPETGVKLEAVPE